jgi:tetratricopeptide (TPR) repeat protein
MHVGHGLAVRRERSASHRDGRGARRSLPRHLLRGLLAVVAVCIGLAASPAAGQSRRPAAPPPAPSPAPIPPPVLAGADRLNRAYDAIFDADFERARALIEEACPPAPREACLVLEATRQFWRIQIDPEDRSRDAAFETAVTSAIATAEAWTEREPRQPEAWFYLGGAYGARVQWRVLRQERLGAARDGREVKNALDRTLALAPSLVDAQFGLGLYEYYADVAPTAARILRVLLMLPGGDRARGLARMQQTRQSGQLLADEAAFQLHVVYFWYENRAADAIALLEELVRRHPRNPYFRRIIAEAQEVYLHDTSAALASWRELARLADSNGVNEGALARAEAHLGYATALDALGDTDLAVAELTRLRAAAPLVPWGITNRIALALGRAHDRLGNRTDAEALLRQVAVATSRHDPLALGDAARRLLQRPTPDARGRAHRLGLEAWRAFTADASAPVEPRFEEAITLDPHNGVTRLHYARVLAARQRIAPAIAELDAVVAAAKTTPASTIGEALLLGGRLREQQRDRDGALAAYRRAAATFGAAAATRNAASRAIERLERSRSPQAFR